MKLLQLRYFVSACKHQSITKAAKEHFISQPSVTNAVKDLEEKFNIQLIQRRSKGFTLTAEGQILYKKAEELINQADNISDLMFDVANSRNIIHLGISPMVATMLFTKVYAGFKHKYPLINIVTREDGSKNSLENIREEIVDIVITPKIKLSDEYDYVTIYKTELLFCVSPENELAQFERVSIEQLKDVPLILFKEGFLQAQEIKKLFTESGLEPNIIHYTGQFSTMREFVKNNLAMAPIYKDIAKREPDLHGLSLDTPINVDIIAVWKKNRRMHSDSLKLLDYLKNMY